MTPEELFEENMRLAYHVAHRMMAWYKFPFEAEDVFQESLIALWRACHKFEPERGWKFSTFAVRAVANDLLYWVRIARASKRQAETVSLHAPLRGMEGGDLDIGDTIPGGGARLADVRLDLADAPLLRLHLAGFRQREMAKMSGVSQSYVSRRIKAEAERNRYAVMDALDVLDAFRPCSSPRKSISPGWDLRTEGESGPVVTRRVTEEESGKYPKQRPERKMRSG